jgi:hypothetical protein
MPYFRLNGGKLALFAIFSLATACAFSIGAPNEGIFVLGVALSLAIFVAAALLNYFGVDWIARLLQFVTAFGLLFLSHPGIPPHLPLNLRIALGASSLIAMAIPAMTWPPRLSAIDEARSDHAPN